VDGRTIMGLREKECEDVSRLQWLRTEPDVGLL
jgi:hypothetical protein